MITLYSYWRSSSAWRVRIALHYKGIPHQVVAVNIAPGQDQQYRSEYVSKNPLAQVPMLELETGGTTARLVQSMAILDYLEQCYPAPPLLPAEPLTRAYALQAAETINAGIQPLQNLQVLSKLQGFGIDTKEWTRDAIAYGLSALELWATERAGTFSVGDQLSVADVLLIPQLYNARRVALDPAVYPTLLRIEENCLKLKAFSETHPISQPDAQTRD